MSFDPDKTKQQISNSIGAMVLLHSSNQALIEVSITPSQSPWYPILNQELGTVENLVVDWRNNGFLYFQTQILQEIAKCGQAFIDAKQTIDGLFTRLDAQFSQNLKDQIAAELLKLQSPVTALQASIQTYIEKLASYQSALSVPHHKMLVTANQVQSQAKDIQSEITTINTQISDMKTQLIKDRQAIAKAEAAEHRGIAETIFGILLAPFTGGASLILAGIGVGSIVEGKEKINQLESNISSSQKQIASDQGHLSDDKKQIATLHGLTMSVDVALSDVANIDSALGSLRTSWSVLDGEIKAEAGNVSKATNAGEAIMGQIWFDAACIGWTNIIQFVQDYGTANAPTPKRVTIGTSEQRECSLVHKLAEMCSNR